MRKTLHSPKELGLTLVEVLVSILILGLSVSTILGLQSSILRRAIQDRNQRTAMLIARSILAKIETSPEDFGTQQFSMSADRFIKQKIGDYGYNKEALDETKDYNVSLNIQDKEVPIFSEASGVDVAEMREVNLTIFWGEASDENIEVVFYSKKSDE